ncbi:hypothetical protein [Microvirga rosea]|uniref:hypothetical protein n=1 Tax=Microvirga rosea TaxID=2715425 RepID=UPI001D0BB17D|nr:hypothetical protein [Microvirga rosea]MCB8820589.1 hypothetical protein [Microvirga rosea]
MKREKSLRKQRKLQDLTAKALRRSEKLASTLTKLTVRGDLNDASIGTLLKKLEQALPQLRRLSGQRNGSQPKGDEQRDRTNVGTFAHEAPSSPKSEKRKAKRQAVLASAAPE